MSAAKKPSFSWLRPPKVPENGVMSLADHLRELRYRIIICLIAIIGCASAAAFCYNQLYQLLMLPYLRAVEMLSQSDPQLTPSTVISGVTTPFMLAVKICAVAGLAIASPVWLFHLWRFITPALLAKEKRYATYFLASAIPLFLIGVGVGYYILPQGISAMLSFTPESVPITNLLEVNAFLSLTLQLMVAFGLGFLVPVVVVGLNLVGVVRAKALAKARPYVVFGIFIFGAVATPSTDPFSMLALSFPMVVLYLVAEVIAVIHDKRRDKVVPK